MIKNTKTVIESFGFYGMVNINIVRSKYLGLWSNVLRDHDNLK